MSSTALAAAGFFAPLVLGLLSARLTLLFRARNFRRVRATEKSWPGADLDLTEVVRTPAELRIIDAYRAIAAEEHQAARSLQDQCIECVVFASAALFTAFFSFALGATLLVELEGWHAFGAAADVSALLAVLGGFWRVRVLRPRWLRARIVAEFVRQWGATNAIFAADPEHFTAPFEEFVSRTRISATAGDDPSVAARALKDSRSLEIAGMFAPSRALTGSQLRLYLRARPLRQARWFATSIARLEGNRSSREVAMQVLFVIALLAALVKLVAATHDGGHRLIETAALVFLVASGMAAASTSAYLARNNRSVLHRYKAQRASIENWLARHKDVIQIARGDVTLTPSQIASAANAVKEFEDLMSIELIDWLEISEADGMDLGLS